MDVLDIPSQVPFDYMHLVLQGHSNWLLDQFFHSTNKSFFDIRDCTKSIDSLIDKMKVPHFITRKFPRIETNAKLKSSEIKIFILYWAVPLLMNYIKNPFWYILCQYVFSVRILYEPIKNKNNLLVAENLMKSYVKNIDYIFKKTSYTLHAHLHLARQVYAHGPLHCHSQFVFEVFIFCSFSN